MTYEIQNCNTFIVIFDVSKPTFVETNRFNSFFLEKCQLSLFSDDCNDTKVISVACIGVKFNCLKVVWQNLRHRAYCNFNRYFKNRKDSNFTC